MSLASVTRRLQALLRKVFTLWGLYPSPTPCLHVKMTSAFVGCLLVGLVTLSSVVHGQAAPAASQLALSVLEVYRIARENDPGLAIAR